MRLATFLLAATLFAAPAMAGEAWDELQPAIFGDRIIADGSNVIALNAPYRAEDERAVPISAEVAFKDGRKVKSLTFIIDENPMPVSAAFKFDKPQDAVAVGAKFRFNGPTSMRAVVEDDEGKLYMTEAYVKTIGLGACASPPVKNAAEALATLGDMDFNDQLAKGAAAQTGATHVATLDVSHPNLTGLQKDQITLLYILPRYVNRFDIWQGEEKLVSVEGGISISEDPEITFAYRDNGAGNIKVRIEDTDGTRFERVFDVTPGS